MIKFMVGEERQAIKEFAKEIVNAIAKGNYKVVGKKVDDLGSWNIEFLSEFIEHYKEDNGLEEIDDYEGCGSWQEHFYPYNDKSGIGYEYAFTSDAEKNDLTLSMEFLFEGEYLKVIFESGITVL